jgi:hypothetical protein
MIKGDMLPATIGSYNQRTQPIWAPTPRPRPQQSQPQPQPQRQPQSQQQQQKQPGQRKAGEASLDGKKKQDPTRELEKEILGK